ncbi:MAG: flagellar motor protein MotB [Pseudomonadota bacterium]
MSAQAANARPIIIKRKKKGGGDGHHGGAWKVAYADFVTAMMAFFMLMWLLNATTEQQRKGIADYFAPTIAISRTSGGGDGSFGGDSVFSQERLPQVGSGAVLESPTESDAARGESDGGRETTDEIFQTLEAQLLGKGGESALMENSLEHIVTRLTDEGLVIEIFEIEGRRLFEPESNQPTLLSRELARIISSVAQTVTNGIAIGGHVRSQPVVVAENSVWDLSGRRATAMRKLLEDEGIVPGRMERVSGHADRDQVVSNPMSVRNNRLEIILLR